MENMNFRIADPRDDVSVKSNAVQYDCFQLQETPWEKETNPQNEAQKGSAVILRTTAPRLLMSSDALVNFVNFLKEFAFRSFPRSKFKALLSTSKVR